MREFVREERRSTGKRPHKNKGNDPPYAHSMCPILITAEDGQDIAIACQIVYANVTL